MGYTLTKLDRSGEGPNYKIDRKREGLTKIDRTGEGLTKIDRKREGLTKIDRSGDGLYVN